MVSASSPFDTYRGWDISFDYPPIPTREFDWSATHPDYDGAEDANDGRHVHARTRDLLLVEIDDWYAENAPFLSPQREHEFREALRDPQTRRAVLIGAIDGATTHEMPGTMHRVREMIRLYREAEQGNAA